jgi:transcriptional regulator
MPVLVSRLTAEEVIEIRRKWKEGARQDDLAREYLTTQGNISAIVNRRTWAHVGD